jgi:predicted negative regulator of RcsB-dependent stress response
VGAKMSAYMTEEEQIEAIKKWWQRYQNIILTSISIVLLVFAGFRYWNWSIEKQSLEASVAYEHMMVAFTNKENKVIKSYANQLIENYPKTVYADAAHLILAKMYVSKEKLDEALEQLQFVSEHSSMSSLKQVANIRKARILTMKRAYPEALQVLSVVNEATYLPLINELKGDIYAATKEYTKAIAFYQLAMVEVQNKGVGNVFLEMKANEMASLIEKPKKTLSA